VPELVDRACLTEDLPGRGVLEQAGERGPRARLEEGHGMGEDHQRRPARDQPRQQPGQCSGRESPAEQEERSVTWRYRARQEGDSQAERYAGHHRVRARVQDARPAVCP
jgi:hypothetical protein